MLDFEDLPAYMDYLSGNVLLSPEQRAAVQSSLVILKQQMNFSHLCFWGRVHGSQRDYYIVQGVDGNDWYNRRTLFSQVKPLISCRSNVSQILFNVLAKLMSF